MQPIDEFFDVRFDACLHAVRDADGRTLGEQRTAEDLRSDVEMTLKTCPYAGSRKDRIQPMNVSALLQVTRHWRGTMDSLAVLRSAHLVRHPRKRFGLPDAYQIARSATLIPAYLTRRGVRPLDVVPVSVSVLFKVMIGYVGAFAAMAFDLALQEGVDWPSVTAAQLFDYAEERCLFLGQHQVCAGPPGMIIEALGVVLDDKPCRAVTSSQLGLTVADLEDALDYADRVVQLELTKALWAVEVRRIRAACGLPAIVDAPDLSALTFWWELDEIPENERDAVDAECRARAARYLRASAEALGPLPKDVTSLFELVMGCRSEDFANTQAVARAAMDELRRRVHGALGLGAEIAPLTTADLAGVFGSLPPPVQDRSLVVG